jgi:hypothetical protein
MYLTQKYASSSNKANFPFERITKTYRQKLNETHRNNMLIRIFGAYD